MDINSLEIAAPLLVLALGAVAGVVEGIKRAFDKDWKVLSIIVGSGITGAILGLILPFNEQLALSIVTGLVVGFSATGYITIAQNVGSK